MMNLRKKPIENIVRKGYSVGNEHFLFFHTMFSTFCKTISIFLAAFANAFNLIWSKILSIVKELTLGSKILDVPSFGSFNACNFLLFYRSVENKRMSDFFRNDFSTDRWRKAALKNAFDLLGKQRFDHAAGFFLLAGSLNDAIEVRCMVIF